MAKSVDQPAPVKIELGKNILRSLLGLKATLYEGLSHFLKGARVILLLFFASRLINPEKRNKLLRGKKCMCGHTSLRRLRTEQSSSELPITPMISVSLTLTASQDFLSETIAVVELRQSRWCWLHFWDTGRKQVWFSTHSFRVWLLKKDLSACTECLGNRGHSKLALLVLTLMYTVIVLIP